MGFGGGGSGSSSIATGTDVSLSTPLNGQVLTYDSSVGKWKNIANAGGSNFTATKDIATTGALTLTAGTSATLTKCTGSLTANRIITLAGTTANALFELSFIDTVFNGFTLTVTNGTFSHVFSYPTYVKYVYIGGWERVI